MAGGRAVAQDPGVKKNLEGFGIRIHRYMRYTQSEKMEIIRMVEESPLSVTQTLREMDISRSSFYEWYKRYQEHGYDGLASKYKTPVRSGIRSLNGKSRSVEVAREYPEKSSREIACHITDMGLFYL